MIFSRHSRLKYEAFIRTNKSFELINIKNVIHQHNWSHVVNTWADACPDLVTLAEQGAR